MKMVAKNKSLRHALLFLVLLGASHAQEDSGVGDFLRRRRRQLGKGSRRQAPKAFKATGKDLDQEMMGWMKSPPLLPLT